VRSTSRACMTSEPVRVSRPVAEIPANGASRDLAPSSWVRARSSRAPGQLGGPAFCGHGPATVNPPSTISVWPRDERGRGGREEQARAPISFGSAKLSPYGFDPVTGFLDHFRDTTWDVADSCARRRARAGSTRAADCTWRVPRGAGRCQAAAPWPGRWRGLRTTFKASRSPRSGLVMRQLLLRVM